MTGDECTTTEAPPNLGVQLPYENELPPNGLGQRLYNVAEELAAKRQATMEFSPDADQRLYKLR